MTIDPATTAARDVYRDDIHPNAEGQKVIADALLATLRGRLTEPAATTTAAP